MKVLMLFVLFIFTVISVWTLNVWIYYFLSQDGGEIWGIKVLPDSKSHRKGIIKLILSAVLTLLTGTIEVRILFSILFGSFGLFTIYTVLSVIYGITYSVAYRKRQIRKAKEQTNALVLGQLPILQRANEFILQGTEFFVNYTGIYVKQEGEAPKKIYYGEFGYEALQSENELGLLGQYFLQSYRDFKLQEIKMKEYGTITHIYGMIFSENGSSYINSYETTSVRKLAGYRFVRK